MMPGVTVASNVTVGQGRLQCPMLSAVKATLPQTLKAMNPASHVPHAPVANANMTAVVRRGMCLPADPAKAVGNMVLKGADIFVQRVMVAPGIVLAGPVTAGQGQLI